MLGPQLRLTTSLVALMLCACVTAREPLPQLSAWTAAGRMAPPAQSECPHVASVDLYAIERARTDPATAAEREASRARIQAMLDGIVIPESSPHRPPANAAIVLRSVSPPGGLHSNTLWSVVWRDEAGVWWFWRQNRDHAAPPPPPPPPPPRDSPEYAAYVQSLNQPIADEVRWPPQSGRLGAEQAAALDAALNDPCRAWEPDVWPWDPPMRERASRPGPPPPQDWTPTYVELREGEHVRQIASPGYRGSLQNVLVTVARHPRS